MNEKFKGIFPALLTPFDGQGRVDTEVLGRLVDYNLQKGVDGFYVAGSTCLFLLDAKERLAVMEAVSSRAGGKCTLIAHIGCISTKQAIEYAREAKEMGYDAISSVAPFYYKFSFEEIRRYYFDIVDAVDLPMLIYNFPAFSGVNLTTDNIREFLADDRFLGVKHTSSDFYALEQFKAGFPDKIVYNGYDEMSLAGLSMGADGGIGSTFNFMAEKYMEIRRLFQENDMSAAQALQREVNTILRALVEVGVMQGEKAIMEGLGFPLGQARSPFAPLSGAQKEKLLRLALPTLQTAV